MRRNLKEETSEKAWDHESTVRNLRLIDDLLFRSVMSEQPVLIGKLISAALGKHVEITEVTVQKTITNAMGRELRCDAVAKDTENNGYVTESQVGAEGMNPKRMRFNLGMIDHTAMMRGENDWNKMKDSCVIMFCADDYFRQGKAVYEIPRFLEGKGIIDDGTRMIYVNCTYQGDDEIGRIAHDLMCRNADEIYDADIRKRVKQIKENRLEVKKMCETLQIEYEKGIAYGEKKAEKKMRKQIQQKEQDLKKKDRQILEMEKTIRNYQTVMNAISEKYGITMDELFVPSDR